MDRFYNDENWMSFLMEFEANGETPDDEDQDEYQLDTDDNPDDDTSTEEPNTDDNPDEDQDEYQLDTEDESEEETQEDSEQQEETPEEEDNQDEDQDEYELPDEEGEDTQDGENPEGGDTGSEDDEYSMDGEGEDNEGGNTTSNDTPDDTPRDDSYMSEKLKGLEEVIFDNLSEDEKKVKIKELKELYINVYDKCTNILEIIGSVSRDEETIQIIEYISNTLIDLKHYVNDYINDIFDSKTYFENLSQLQKYIMIFNAINKVFSQIKSENEE